MRPASPGEPFGLILGLADEVVIHLVRLGAMCTVMRNCQSHENDVQHGPGMLLEGEKGCDIFHQTPVPLLDMLEGSGLPLSICIASSVVSPLDHNAGHGTPGPSQSLEPEVLDGCWSTCQA